MVQGASQRLVGLGPGKEIIDYGRRKSQYAGKSGGKIVGYRPDEKRNHDPQKALLVECGSGCPDR